jgi:hypothetical protein
MTEVTIPAATSLPDQSQPDQPQKHGQVKRTLLAIAVGLALVFAGTFLSHAIYPAAAGPRGDTGASGLPGPTGPPGSTASDSNLGVCVSTTMDPTFSWVVSVSVTTPVLTDGTQSCPTGSFVSVLPAASS